MTPATTGLVWHADYLEHRTGPHHPERPARLTAVLEGLEASGVAAELDRVEAPPIDEALLDAVHDPAYLARARGVCAEGGNLDSEDTVVSPGSWRAALLAAGGAVEACDRVAAGTWRNGFVACRPPGHHAERAVAMGFCILNNVALAAEHLRRAHGLERVAIVDWDVHHGNGTQHAFEADPGVFYASLHQWPLYPGTGSEREVGVGDGEGTTLNCPLPAGAGDAEWLAAFEDRVLPALDAYRPEFVLISAGFDAHARDPLARTLLTEDAYRRMTAGLLGLADRHAGGRVVALLEGGYDLEALAASTAAHVETLRSAPGA